MKAAVADRQSCEKVGQNDQPNDDVGRDHDWRQRPEGRDNDEGDGREIERKQPVPKAVRPFALSVVELSQIGCDATLDETSVIPQFSSALQHRNP